RGARQAARVRPPGQGLAVRRRGAAPGRAPSRPRAVRGVAVRVPIRRRRSGPIGALACSKAMVSQDILHRPVKPMRSAQRAWGSAGVRGASAGGLMALERLFTRLPPDFKAPVFVVLHLGARPSEFPALLARHSAMPCRYAHDREEVRPGRIYIAPPD